MALLFEDEEAARKIFERWRERFGKSDRDEEIFLAVIRNLRGESPHHYIMMITSKHPEEEEREPGQLIVVASRSMTMTPDDSTNLNLFLEDYGQSRAYFLLPAVLRSGKPKLISDLAIMKCQISVKDASNVGEGDIEAMALRMRGKPSAHLMRRLSPKARRSTMARSPHSRTCSRKSANGLSACEARLARGRVCSALRSGPFFAHRSCSRSTRQ